MNIPTVGNKYLVLLFFFFLGSCGNNTETFTTKERSLLRDGVKLMTDSIANTVSNEGPVAWLKYFENSPDFFMVSDGRLVFPNIDTARYFINNVLIKMIPKIQLRWSNTRIDPLTTDFAAVSAVYHEDITDSAGRTTVHDGYFTAIAHHTSQGWKLHNAHWSSTVAH